jgi:hypothetical protein
MTDDSKIEAKKDALREFKRRRRVPWFAFLGLIFFSVNIFTAIKASTVFGPFLAGPSWNNAGWLSHAMTISYQDHPGLYIFIVSFSVVAVAFYGGMLYTYYFKKIPD